MARDNPNNTILKTTDEIEYDYAEAAEHLDVGDVVELAAGELQAHSSEAAQVFAYRFCFESRESGMLANDPDDDGYDEYDAGELAKYITVDGGEHLYLNLASGDDLADAALANVTEDDYLVSNGDGKLRKRDDGTSPDDENAVFLQAKESVDNSGAAAGEFTKLRVEVLS